MTAQAIGVPALDGVPVAVDPGPGLVGETVPLLVRAGTAVDAIDLPDPGIHRNGHGLIDELNSAKRFALSSTGSPPTSAQTTTTSLLDADAGAQLDVPGSAPAGVTTSRKASVSAAGLPGGAV